MRMLTPFAAVIALACSTVGYAVERAEWMRALENVCAFIPSDNLDVEEVEPTPADVKIQYGISYAEIVDGLDDIARKYKPVATNFYHCGIREVAITWIGEYGTTNDVGRLSSILTNSCDHAQNVAMSACLTLLRTTPELITMAYAVVTNDAVYSERIRSGAYVQLLTMSSEPESGYYITDGAQRARISVFFMERAAVETNDTLFVDRCAYTLNHSYRHSQQRRDNLAALRPPGLTGRRAELYDAAQRDAAQSD